MHLCLITTINICLFPLVFYYASLDEVLNPFALTVSWHVYVLNCVSLLRLKNIETKTKLVADNISFYILMPHDPELL